MSSNLYELIFEPTKIFKEYFLQHQIGINFTVDSYLMINFKYVNNSYEDFDEVLMEVPNLIYFKDIEYINGEVSKDYKNLYDNHKENIYENTIKLEKFKARNDFFEFSVPLIKNGYKISGDSKVNAVALFGRNYYTDRNEIETDLKCVGVLVFTKEKIPLYDTRQYNMQINAALNLRINLMDGDIEVQNNFSGFRRIRTYYNLENEIGINILDNITLE